MKPLLARTVMPWLWLVVVSLLGPNARLSAERPSDFAHDVVPILRQHCIACHGGKESKGGFSLNSRELLLEADVINLAAPEKSRLLELIKSTDTDDQMPPKDRARLTEAEIATLQRWIVAELPWESGFTFAEQRYEPPLLPRRPSLPPVQEGRDNPIDRLVDAYWSERHLSRPAPMDDAQFLRRVYLDVVGILPPPDRLASFLQDATPEKRRKLIDELLGNQEAYATHWLTFWNDLLRNAYSGTGYIDGGRKQITEWLYRALYTNLPYDEFVRQLIAPSPVSEGFVRGIKWRGNVNASQIREVQFAQSVSQVFLGINMKCSSCHDSFIDRWTLAETYGLAAVYAEAPLEIHRCDKALGKTASAAWIFPELGQLDPEAPQPARLRQLAQLMTHPQNGRLHRTIVNRLWHRLMGHGIVHPVDAMHTPPWNPDVLDYLAVYLADQGFDLKQVLRLILNSSVYQSHAVASTSDSETGEFVFLGPTARRLTAEQFVDAVWSITGTNPVPDVSMFKRDGRDQNGQLRDVLLAMDPGLAPLPPEDLLAKWGARPLRAAFTGLDSLQAQLGRPIREQIVSSRPTQLTTLQAITLANGAEMADWLHRGSERYRQRVETATAQSVNGVTPAFDWVDELYLSLLARHPSQEERLQCGDPHSIPSTAEIEDLLWSLFMLPEFQIIR